MIKESMLQVTLPIDESFKCNISDDLLHHIQYEITLLNNKDKKEVSLRGLVGERLWEKMDHVSKRNLGKTFKTMVKFNLIPRITLGRKIGNNAQKYNVNG